MNTKTILPIAIMLSLPLMANAANISGDMYTAPAAADTNHPAPTTNVSAPYGRANIDTTDQEHIATTAYVKGAYNSAIAAVNKLNANVARFYDDYSSEINILHNEVNSSQPMLVTQTGDEVYSEVIDIAFNPTDFRDFIEAADAQLVTASAVAGVIDAQRVEIYTTWDDDDVAEIPLITASAQQ